jgi:ActR/RegA family two-component response regulator
MNAMKVMVVDDDATFRARLISALETRGMQASGAGSPQEARESQRACGRSARFWI